MIDATEISPAVATAIERIRSMSPARLKTRPSLLKGIIAPSLSGREQAAQGAAWLDATQPGWHRDIGALGLEMLDLSSETACVFGQLDGDFSIGARARLKTGWRKLTPLLGFNEMDWQQAVQTGPDGPYHRATFRDLTEAWHCEIATRLAADTAAADASDQADAERAMGPGARYV